MPRRSRQRSQLKVAALMPVFEHVMTDALESFLWRCDPYPWQRNVWNFHPEVEIHLIRATSGTELVGDHVGSFGPGRLVIVGGGLPHDWVTSLAPGVRVEGRDIVLQFDGNRLGAASAMLPELSEIAGLLARASRGLAFHGDTRRRAALMLEEMGSMDGLDRFGSFLRLVALLARSREYEFLSSEDYRHPDPTDKLDIVQRSLAYALDNFTGAISLSEMAAKAGMSESAFSRLFKKNNGNSFTEHVAKLRVNLACRLLAETETPITEICFEVGYRNLSNFNTIFRRLKKLTPSAYRRLAAERTSSAARAAMDSEQ